MSKMREDHEIRRPLWMWPDFLVAEIADRMTAQEQKKENRQLENMAKIWLSYNIRSIE
jgi:hypothetical protein